jgi:hypothetical protein
MTPGMMKGAGQRNAAASSKARMRTPDLRRIEARSVICSILCAFVVRKKTIDSHFEFPSQMCEDSRMCGATSQTPSEFA